MYTLSIINGVQGYSGCFEFDLIDGNAGFCCYDDLYIPSLVSAQTQCRKDGVTIFEISRMNADYWRLGDDARQRLLQIFEYVGLKSALGGSNRGLAREADITSDRIYQSLPRKIH